MDSPQSVEVEQFDEPVLPGSLQPAPTVPLVIAAGNGTVVPVGEEKRASEAPAISPLSTAEMAERFGWRATRIEFTGTPLGEAVAQSPPAR